MITAKKAESEFPIGQKVLMMMTGGESLMYRYQALENADNEFIVG